MKQSSERSYRDASCTGKIRHRSKSDAKRQMKRFAAYIGVPSRMFQVYKCCYCPHFHFGHRRGDISEPDTVRYELEAMS